nr:MAG TPA: hypothetical protein [Caudoviricetes sp.]
MTRRRYLRSFLFRIREVVTGITSRYIRRSRRRRGFLIAQFMASHQSFIFFGVFNGFIVVNLLQVFNEGIRVFHITFQIDWKFICHGKIPFNE